MIKFRSCGVNVSCASYISNKNNPTFDNVETIYTTRQYVYNGYNTIELYNGIRVPKGSMLLLKIDSYSPSSIKIDTSGTVTYSDFYFSSSSPSKKLYKLNYFKNYRLYINALIDSKYFETNLPIVRSYESLGSYSLSTSLLTTEVANKKSIDIVNGIF